MYVVLAPALAIGGYGIYRHVRLWRRGQPAARFDSPVARLRLTLRHAIVQSRLARETYAGIFHRLIFFGFIVLTLATAIVLIQYDLNIKLMKGHFYLYYQCFVVDVFGGLVLVGIVMAAMRRWFSKPAKLVYTSEASLILVILFIITFSGFLLEGWRIAVTNDPWAAWSSIGYLFAQASRSVMDVETMRAAHLGMWWFHLALAFGFIAWAPHTKMLHALTSALNIYTANLEPIGANLKSIDFEEAETLGVKDLSGFTWKDLLDLDACTECGKCADACPANTLGKSLSPRDIILHMRDLMHASEPATGNGSDEGVASVIDSSTAVSPEALWECTTCAACVAVCPVYIEQLSKIIDFRRYLVMEEAELPETIQEAVMSLENRGHPFKGVQATRLDWTEGLDVPLISKTENADVLLWVGSAGALQEHGQKEMRALAKLLKRAGVNFAILGREEKSTGDLARRVGNEFLFETLAQENIETLNRYGVRKIVTPCPHAFNTLKNEYPRLGGRYEVHHYTEYLVSLLQDGRLSVANESSRKIAFHDPCYLGRHNGIFDAPRYLIRISTGHEPIEMIKNRVDSFCCGGGGGMSFAEESPEERVNRERTRHILNTDADRVAVACSYCRTMLEDGLSALKGDRDVQVVGIAELLWEAVRAG
jgi:Fe-S oxidoreductase/nitrate reductase gamma subunit